MWMNFEWILNLLKLRNSVIQIELLKLGNSHNIFLSYPLHDEHGNSSASKYRSESNIAFLWRTSARNAMRRDEMKWILFYSSLIIIELPAPTYSINFSFFEISDLWSLPFEEQKRLNHSYRRRLHFNEIIPFFGKFSMEIYCHLTWLAKCKQKLFR